MILVLIVWFLLSFCNHVSFKSGMSQVKDRKAAVLLQRLQYAVSKRPSPDLTNVTFLKEDHPHLYRLVLQFSSLAKATPIGGLQWLLAMSSQLMNKSTMVQIDTETGMIVVYVVTLGKYFCDVVICICCILNHRER